MSDPVYKVTLYACDLKFTNDYSNVLHFRTKAQRDEYFDHLIDIPGNSILEINNTMENKIFLEGGSLKICVNDIDKDNLHKVVYCCIETYLNGGELNNQSKKYYFVNSYDIISSYSNTTVIRFNIEYDFWTNNQFDFVIRESNVERSHKDRWDSDGNILYKSPMIDTVDSYMKVNDKQTFESQKVALFIDNRFVTKDILWCVVTASHTLGRKPDQLMYHVFPVLYKKDDLVNTYTDFRDEEYYYQNCIKYGRYDGRDYYFPALHNLDNYILTSACGNGLSYDGDTDAVKIINVQLLNYLPLSLNYDITESKYTVVGDYGYTEYTFVGGYPFGIFGAECAYITFVVPDLGMFIKNPTELAGVRTIPISVPSKPIDGANYSDTFEPALYMNPVRKHLIVSGDNTAITEINDEIFIKCYKSGSFKFIYNVSYSASAMYNYITIEGYSRYELNAMGFAFNKISYLWDFINDAWAEYCVTQRNSDRAMMWTNIATGGIAESGSTAVSAGIGYRSNMERSLALSNEYNFNKDMSKYVTDNVYSPLIAQRYDATNKYVLGGKSGNINMYKGMAGSAMAMSGIGGVTAFSANAIHQGLAQRAKEKAISNTPSGLATAGNSYASIINKEIETIYMEMICEDTSYNKYKNIFMKYGYYVGDVELPNIVSRKYFNYIKTNGVVLTGMCNNLILSSIANILDSGVTIWHMDYCAIWDRTGEEPILTGDTIYDYTKENIERSLM